MRVAVPCEGQQVSAHFGHASHFAFFDADPDTGQVEGEQVVGAPPHQPGLLPPWLAQHGANVILAGGMGGRARDLFGQHGITVVTGIQESSPKRAVELYLAGQLATRANPCDHDTRPKTGYRHDG